MAETMDRPEGIARDKGLSIFAPIDHATGARSIGITLRPTQRQVFGHPKGGAPFMPCVRSQAFDRPLRARVWEDEDRLVWLSDDDAARVAARHGAGDGPAASGMAGALKADGLAATASP
ncbi:MAG: DUF302 domain-containing protein [Rhodocyclaceae bacterium]|nr:DUF302 domain-containing protein [Rhodocyclaceae bacterium]